MRFRDAAAIIPLLADEPVREQLLELLEADPEMLAWVGNARRNCVGSGEA